MKYDGKGASECAIGIARCCLKKGTAWHFGYKAHIGVDKDSGLIHHVEVTSANVHDVEMTSKLLTGEENELYGDSGYIGAEKRQDAIVRKQAGQEDQVQAESQANADQETVCKRAMESKEGGTSKVVCTS